MFKYDFSQWRRTLYEISLFRNIDRQYEEAIVISGLEKLAVRRDNLCKKFMVKLKDNSHFLHHLTKNYYRNEHGYNLRSGRNNQLSQRKIRTNRCKKFIINIKNFSFVHTNVLIYN